LPDEEENSMEAMPPPIKKLKLPDTKEDKSKEEEARKRQEEREVLLERSRREREYEEIKEEEERRKLKQNSHTNSSDTSRYSFCNAKYNKYCSQLSSFYAWKQQNRSVELEKLLSTLKPSPL
jgi:Na+-translocating ferredoxin:NAD+ oxidoreductase RnfC subunit